MTDDEVFELWREKNPDVWDVMLGREPTAPRPAPELMREAARAVMNPVVLRELQKRAA